MTKKGPPQGRDRRVPRLREQCQEGYELLTPLMERAGYGSIVEPLKSLETVDDVLRRHPEVVSTLLTAAWELRSEKQFCHLFKHKDSGEIVDSKDDPIAPCGRTFNEVVLAHLYGAARLYLDRLEKRWAVTQARQAENEYRQAQERKRKTLTGRLFGGLKELAVEQPTFSADDYRADYPSYGLYDRIKPYLTSIDQFRLIPLYGKLQTRQIDALGDLLSFFTQKRDLEALARLSAEDIAQVKGFSRAFAETKLGVSANAGRMGNSRGKSHDPEQEAEDAAKRAKLPQEERRMFDLLLTRYLDCLPALKDAGNGAETIIRRLTPIFGEDVFTLFRSPLDLQNAINCPDFMLKIVGTSARKMAPQVAESLSHIQNKDITRDILNLAMQTFPRDELEAYMSDESRRPVWFSLPAKFNNNYNYQADAPGDSNTLRNYENLTTVCEGIFESLRTGRFDNLS